MKVRFSEIARAGLRQYLAPDRWPWCEVSLAFYLTRDHEVRAMRLRVFEDIEIYVFPFGEFRVIYEIVGEEALVWSFTRRADAK